METFSGNIVDVLNGEIYPGTLLISEGKNSAVIKDSARYNTFIIPGFIDAHLHIERSRMRVS